MPFDPDSGLVFSERVVRKPSATARENSMRCIGMPPPRRSTGRGSGPLASHALRQVLCSLNQLDSGSLSYMPDRLLEMIWKAVQRSQLDSLHVWRLFAQVGNADRQIVVDHCKTISSLDKAIQQVYDPSCAWVTTLDILTGTVSDKEFVQVSKFQNLRRIHVATGPSSPAGKGLSDRVLKSWAEQAQQEGAFAHLQSMFLYRQTDVTNWSLDRLAAFPALDEFCAYKCSIRAPSLSLRGWRNSSRHGFAGFVKSVSGIRYIGHPTRSWNSLVADYLKRQRAASKDAVDDLPILSMLVPHSSPALPLPEGALIVCLQRCADVPLEERQKPESSTTLTKSATRPPMKKRKLVTDSAALTDML